MRFWFAQLLLLFVALVSAKKILDNGDDSIATSTTTTLRVVGASPTPQLLVARQGDPIDGAPPVTNTNGPAPPTTYFQTTFDANGEAIGTATFIFTPSFAATSSRSQYPTGTVYNYDSWTASYATATFLPNAADKRQTASFVAVASSLVAGVLLAVM